MRSTPLEEQETAVNWMRGDKEILVDTSDSTTLTKLKTAGWPDEGLDPTGHYKRFRLPINAITFRSRAAVENKRQGPDPSVQRKALAASLEARKRRG